MNKLNFLKIVVAFSVLFALFGLAWAAIGTYAVLLADEYRSN